MLFMVIERFKPGCSAAIGARFRTRGRMLPEGVAYLASWVEPSGERCFQIMEAPDAALLGVWTGHWNDLVDFEIVPVLTSGDYWAKKNSVSDPG
jgi:hypothetical protein